MTAPEQHGARAVPSPQERTGLSGVSGQSYLTARNRSLQRQLVRRRVYSEDTDAAQILDKAKPRGSGGRGGAASEENLGRWISALTRAPWMRLQAGGNPTHLRLPTNLSGSVSPQDPIHSAVGSAAVPS